jgi:3-keto-disaccharide hydrolase
MGLAVSVRAEERVIDFNQFPAGKTPAGFRAALAGGGKPGDWRVIVDSSDAGTKARAANPPDGPKVLAQLSQDRTDERFPMLIYDQESFGDFVLTTRFKMVAGLFEQMAGIAFRIQDTNNYYYVRASALGKGSFRFVKVVQGQRAAPLGPEIAVKRGVWHDLRIEANGNRLDFLLDGKQVIPSLNDNSFVSGKIGFWTKSDAVSYFDRTTITYVPHETLAQLLVRDALKTYPRLAGLRIYTRRADEKTPRIVASNEKDEIGQPGGKVEQDVIDRDVLYYGKDKQVALVTLPLHDRNGDVAGAVRVALRSFPGQTELNALARAQPVVKLMERRVRAAKDLLQ